MIKFFRKIRQNLLMENKTGKYFKYAIGEIILVVIGILIALQINNWNEARKKEQVEKQVLISLFQEVEKDRMMFKEIDYLYKNDLRSLTYFRNLIWQEKHSMEDALSLNGFEGIAFRDVNPNRITYDEMISTGKIYYLSNQALVNEIINYYEIIESYIYELRQSRVEFRSNFYDVSAMADFWLTNYDNDNKELAYHFANNQTTETYKQLKIISEWSIVNIRYSKNSITNLYSKASQLQKLIDKELEHSLIRTDDSKPSEENKATMETIELKRISELVTAGKDIDAIIEIIKKEDKNQPNYFISHGQINSLAYKLMRQDKNNDALKLFKLNIELYPNEFNVYDSYGEILLKMGDTENGIKAYKKSLELNSDNTNAKIILSEFE
jgi:tetratricopeptide (TPR) repeat protein